MLMFNGMTIIENNSCILGVSNIPKRKHKSKRIQKKWIKKYGYKLIPDPKVYIFDDKIIGHPITINKIIKKIAISQSL